MQKPNTRSQRNYHLDAIRVLAALSVLVTHLRALYFAPYKETGSTVLVKALYVEHYLARGGVLAFFVLSGYLVGNSVMKSIAGESWSWRDYLLRRLTRLEIVLIPALLITAVLDYYGTRFSSLYADQHAAYTLRNFLGCLVFLQLAIKSVLPFGSDGSLWSLSYEFWYYILFPLALLIGMKKGKLLLLWPLLVAVVWLTYGNILFLFPCWLGGVFAGFLARKYPMSFPVQRWGMITISVLGILGVTVACGAHRLNLHLADYLFAIFTILLIWASLCMPLRSPTSAYARSVVLLSEFSYTLYLTHLPFLFFLKAIWLGTRTWAPDSRHVLLAALPFFASIVFAFGCYLLFESRTERVRLWISQRLPMAPAAYKPDTVQTT